ncbi:hypothetical protein [Microbacterium rhizomatis]|uniref:DUF3168 domain-containing protein n=1 Tax=Microbacterium rhizomatis TaxID=1631477 RepID=A0A5J5IZP9_9MICO|nr:hypothetical protein [Microbacterium rhizomatis]KAA9105008.1 hypothetical protein F6B43_18340 [Microbacterium rhizomatis]
MSTSVRAGFAAQLTTDWAGITGLVGVRVLATERNIDPPVQPTALIQQKSLGRLPEVPLSHRGYGMHITIISSHEDMDLAADELDILVPAVLDYLGTRHTHEPAVSGLYVDRLCYRIPLTLIAKD